MSRGRLVFDGQCGFCTRSIGWIRRLDRHGRVECVPLQYLGAPASVGASEQECRAAVQWRGVDGRRCSGAEAVNAALCAALGTGLPLAVYAATRPLQDRAYAWIAVNRYRFRGVTAHCTARPGDCASCISGRRGCA